MLTAHSTLTAPDAPPSIVLALGDMGTSLRPTRPVSRRRRHWLLPSLSAAAAVPSSRALLMTMPSPIHPALLAPLRLSPTRDLLIVALAVEPHVQGPTLPQRLSLLACRQIRRDKKPDCTPLHGFKQPGKSQKIIRLCRDVFENRSSPRPIRWGRRSRRCRCNFRLASRSAQPKYSGISSTGRSVYSAQQSRQYQ